MKKNSTLLIRKCLCSFVHFLAALFIAAGSADAQPVKKYTITTNGSVNTVTRDGNTVFMGGSFTTAGFNSGKAALITPTNDVPSADFPKTNGTVNSVISDGASGWYLGGTFTQVGNILINRLCHIKSDQTVDLLFNPNPNSTVNALLLDGTTLYAAGSFTSIAGNTLNRIASLNAVTGVANSWNPNANSTVSTISKIGNYIYVGGSFTVIAGVESPYFAKLDAVTGLASQTIVPNYIVNSIVADNNNIYAGGNFNNGGFYTNFTAHYSSGTDIPTWGFPIANGSINVILPDGTGGWYVGGNFTVIGGITRNRIAHILANMTIDPNFNPDANSTVYCMTLAGNILTGNCGFVSTNDDIESDPSQPFAFGVMM